MSSRARDATRRLRTAAVCVVLPLTPAAAGVEAQSLYVEAARVHVSPDRTLGHSIIQVRDGRIVGIGSAASTTIPADARRLTAEVVIAGLIDARTTAGLSSVIEAGDDTDDRGGPVRPELRAEDGFDLRDALLATALRSGVTLVQTGPGDANSIGGQTAIVHTAGETVADALVRSPSGVVFSLTEDAKTTYGARNRLPTTRMANVALIRQALIDAERHARSEDATPDAGREALGRVLSGETKAIIAAARADEIATALRIAREFDLPLVLTGAADAYAVLDLLDGAGVPVLLSPPAVTRAASGGPPVAGVASRLHARGIRFALVTGDLREGATLLDWVRETVRHGLSESAALAAITTAPAALLGMGDRKGTVETGRDADLVLLDGEPFEAGTRVRAVIARGRVAWQAAGLAAETRRD